jgi:hypothetical protein
MVDAGGTRELNLRSRKPSCSNPECAEVRSTKVDLDLRGERNAIGVCVEALEPKAGSLHRLEHATHGGDEYWHQIEVDLVLGIPFTHGLRSDCPESKVPVDQTESLLETADSH